jgi:hypothetical protein
MSTATRTPIQPEPWLKVGRVAWSHWDLWFCVVACLDHDVLRAWPAVLLPRSPAGSPT